MNLVHAPQNSVLGANGIYFSRIFRKPVRIEGSKRKLGPASDIVFALAEPFPRAVGICIDHGWGVPNEFVPWDKVVEMSVQGPVVKAPGTGEQYPPFQDQEGWILVDKHLMGRTILDIDDRKTEVVNDVLLRADEGGYYLAAVDASFNGFLRKWGLLRLTSLISEDLIPWKFVQPLSLEDVTSSDRLQLSVTKEQLHDLPKEDLADALEELNGQEQEALFSALETDKAAETLTEAEPRAQRQIIASLREERAQNILARLSTPQLVDLLGVLPHEDAEDMLRLLPEERQRRVRALLSEREATARDFMSPAYLTVPPDLTVAQARDRIRQSGLAYNGISYLYVEGGDGKLQGAVDARFLLVSEDAARLEDLMDSPAVAAEADDIREDLEALFAKYHFRMVPVVDLEDHILGVIRYNDIMRGAAPRPKA
jgi:CBS domain-containing protein